MRSLSEIETAAKRATRGVGFSWGNSEEVGKCVRLLELFGLPGVKNLNQYYKERETKKFENLNLINENNKPSSEDFCPIILGISFLDQIKSLENYQKIEFNKIAYPLIFLSFLSRASEIIGKKIHAKFDKKEIFAYIEVGINAGQLIGNKSFLPEVIGIRTQNFKYYRHRIDKKKYVHLYNLKNDPLEKENIASSNLEKICEFEIILSKLLENNNTQNISPKNKEDAIELLKKLGYV